MGDLQGVLAPYVESGHLPGAVALVARGDEVEVAVVGTSDVAGTRPLTRASVFRIASITKPITAAAAMVLVDDGVLALDDPVREWLPELAQPVVVRDPAGPVDDVVPAARPVTVLDLLTFRAGWGFPSDFSLPAVQPLLTVLQQGPPPGPPLGPDAWVAALATIPMLAQPGQTWLYNTCSDVLGVLLARASGSALPDLLAERVLAPLGMTDTGFTVSAAQRDRLVASYRPDAAGVLQLVDDVETWSAPPAFPSGAGGLVSTLDDWHRFGRMLLAGGTVGDRPLLTREAVRLMTTDHLDAAQRAASGLFLEGQGWGFGGSVDVDDSRPWNVPGRYGWVGGTGTSAHVTPATGVASVLLTQREMTGPTPPEHMRALWQYAR